LAGANLIYGLGMLDMGVTFDFKQLLMDSDVADMVKYTVAGIPVNDETLSVDIIKDVGYAKNFLSHKNTFTNRFIQSAPKLIDRRTRVRWLEDQGGLDMFQRAQKQFKDLYDNYQPQPLPPGAFEAIRAIVNKAEADFGLPKSDY
jgi:trimethylamine--corrinoid protein Co-methyltransferase